MVELEEAEERLREIESEKKQDEKELTALEKLIAEKRKNWQRKDITAEELKEDMDYVERASKKLKSLGTRERAT